jgi:hypothetical protein
MLMPKWPLLKRRKDRVRSCGEVTPLPRRISLMLNKLISHQPVMMQVRRMKIMNVRLSREAPGDSGPWHQSGWRPIQLTAAELAAFDSTRITPENLG